jgi:hypothetical protein
VTSFAFGEDAGVLEHRGRIRRLVEKMVVHDDEIRRRVEGEVTFGEAAAMAIRPFENGRSRG